MLMTEGKWVRFEKAEKHNPKTGVWDVIAKEDGIVLGQVKWFARWRKYVFHPGYNTVYELDCLSDISLFLSELMRLWRNKKR